MPQAFGERVQEIVKEKDDALAQAIDTRLETEQEWRRAYEEVRQQFTQLIYKLQSDGINTQRYLPQTETESPLHEHVKSENKVHRTASLPFTRKLSVKHPEQMFPSSLKTAQTEPKFQVAGPPPQRGYRC